MSRFSSIVNKTTQCERKTHYVSNILITAILSLVIIISLFGGVKVNIGSTYKGDGEDIKVRHSIYQLIDVALSGMMTREEAMEYVDKTNKMLLEEYNVVGYSHHIVKNSDTDKLAVSANYDNLNQFGDIIGDGPGKLSLRDASKINILKYKFAYAVAIGDTSEVEHSLSWSGHVVYALAGQAIFIVLVQLAMMIIALLMLVSSVIALIKKKENYRGKLALMLMCITIFAYIILLSLFGFYSPDASGALLMVLIPLAAVLYILLRHAMMEKGSFSKTMFIHNSALLLGSLLCIILFLSPLFKVENNAGAAVNYGWSFVFDMSLAEGMYFNSPMAYFLMSVIVLIFILPAILMMILCLAQVSRFMSCNYEHNEPKVFLILSAVVNLIISIGTGATAGLGEIRISSHYLNFSAGVNVGLIIFQLLILGGMIAMEYLYKVKPIKRELVVN